MIPSLLVDWSACRTRFTGVILGVDASWVFIGAGERGDLGLAFRRGEGVKRVF